jgi:hypothetical protein
MSRKYKEVTLTYRKPLYSKRCLECGAKFEGTAIQVRCSRQCTARANARTGRQRRKAAQAQEQVAV